MHLIETHRLLRILTQDVRYPRNNRENPFVPTVKDNASDLRQRIREALAHYATASQSLDQSFPQRLLKTGVQPSSSIADLKARMSDLESKRTEFHKIGLLDSAMSSTFEMGSLDNLEASQRMAISLYVEDTEKKLAVFDNLARRITLLRDNINEKFEHKVLKISREHGFVAVGHDGNPLEPDLLSSGEQHELVLLYDLLFRVLPGTLVLIDEPELSLHISWQKRFLPDLLEDR